MLYNCLHTGFVAILNSKYKQKANLLTDLTDILLIIKVGRIEIQFTSGQGCRKSRTRALSACKASHPSVREGRKEGRKEGRREGGLEEEKGRKKERREPGGRKERKRRDKEEKIL